LLQPPTMTDDDFFTLSLYPAHLPGIHNYCDRWCERCPFAERCVLNATLRQLRTGDAPAETDTLVEHLKMRLESARVSIDRRWTGRNISGDVNIDRARDPVHELEDERRRERRRAHPMLREANAYASLVGAWFDTETTGLKIHADEIARCAETGDPDLLASPAMMARALDALEIVRRDAYHIASKLHRAISGREDFGRDDGPPDDPIQNDFNGSAKVALLCLDRSESAWRIIHRWYPGSGTSVLLAEHLAMLRAIAEREFPDARRFLRVGFDGTRAD
jgi:hypothetical protein